MAESRYYRDHPGATFKQALAWHVSTRSEAASGSCVEAGPVLDGSGRVAVRHSKAPDAEVIVYTRAEWNAFLAGAKGGEFDFVDR